MVIFDAVMHHGGRRLTKITDKSLDPIRDKLFRVVVNGESRIVSVNNRNELVTFKKLENLPKEIQDKLIDGTFIAKDGSFKVVKNTPEAASVEPLTPAAVRGLGDIPLQQAVELSKILGTETVNTSAPQLGGKRLQTLAESFGVKSTKGLIEENARKGRLNGLVKFADNLEAARSVELKSPQPLSANSIVLDNNSLIGIKYIIEGKPWNEIELSYQNAVNKIREQQGLAPLISNPVARDLKTIIGNADVRLPNTVLSESNFRLGVSGSGLKIRVNRNSIEYTKVLEQLEKAPMVGGNKGYADRAAIADSIFAETQSGVVSKFMTSDAGILKQIVRFATGNKIQPKGQESIVDAIIRERPNGFEIEINNQKLFIIPIASK